MFRNESHTGQELSHGRYEKAVELGERAYKLDPDKAEIASNLSIAYHYLGNTKKRDEMYKRAEELGHLKLATLKEIYSGEMEIPVVQEKGK